ncbi:hypothetical protein SHIRM173S_04582 [Streptomyces hirsutus]
MPVAAEPVPCTPLPRSRGLLVPVRAAQEGTAPVRVRGRARGRRTRSTRFKVVLSDPSRVVTPFGRAGLRRGCPALLAAVRIAEARQCPAAERGRGVTFDGHFLPTSFATGRQVGDGAGPQRPPQVPPRCSWTPVLNNIVQGVVTLGTFVWVTAPTASPGPRPTSIPPEGERLLGIGVQLSLIVQSLAVIP